MTPLGRSRVLGRVRLAAGMIVLWLSTFASAEDAGSAFADREVDREAAPSTELPRVELPLERLPEAPSRRLPRPSAEDLSLLDGVLDRLVTDNPTEHQAALAALLEVDASLLAAVYERIDTNAQGADRAAMKQLLLDTRKRALTELEQAMKARGERGEPETPDYLPMLLGQPKPESEHWRRLVKVLALSRICVAIGTTDAVRVLIRAFVRFEFLRIDTQLQLKKLGDRALAALIEATRHEAPSVSSWAKRRLDFIGKAIPSEVVQVEDPTVLADVLRAYGYTREPDAARIVISFANSERTQVREAARQAVGLFGETAHWPLRDTFETMVGRKPAREWSWDRTARELFRELDRIRLSELYEHYQRGLAALEAGNLGAMRVAFDKVIARSPDFEPRERIVEGYLRYAREHLQTEPELAAQSLQRVLRLSSAEPATKAAQSSLLTLEALELSRRQVADRALLQQALELDTENEVARELLGELSREPLVESSGFMRVLWPSVLAGLSLLFAGLVALRHVSLRTSKSS